MGEIENRFLEEFPVLESARLNLVEIKHGHLMDLFALFSDPEVTRYYNIKTFGRPEDGQIYLDWFRCRFESKLGIRWGISIKGVSGIIGTIGFNNFIAGHRANMGYDMQSAYWHKGYMTEALNTVVAFGFNELKINRIEAEVMTGNTASERLLEKAGFQKEGVLRDWMCWDKRYFDMVMYSYLRADYEAY